MHRVGLLIVALSLAAASLAETETAREAWRDFEESISAADRLRSEGRPEQSERCYLEAIERSRPFGERNLRRARAVDGLADLYAGLGRITEAEPLYREALAMWEQLLGPEQPRVATTLHNLAALYLAHGEAERAEPLVRRSLGIWEATLGPRSLEVAVSLDALAAVLERTGRRPQAEPLRERARGIRDGRSR